MIITQEGKIIASCVGGARKGGSGTITAGNENVTVAHGLGATPAWAIAHPSNDAAQATGLKTVISGANIIVSYPTSVTQPDDGTFYFEVGV